MSRTPTPSKSIESIPNDLLYHFALTNVRGRDIINLCSTNQRFNRILCGNPQLWKDLYLRDLSDTSVPEGNYRERYLKFTRLTDGKDVNDILIEASELGYEKVVNQMINQGATYFDRAMAEAAGGGHERIVQMMLDRGATNRNWAMEAAARGGHERTVQMMLDRGATNFNSVMNIAAEGGHERIVQMMLDRGATDFDWAMNYAAKAGHGRIVQLLRAWKESHP